MRMMWIALLSMACSWGGAAFADNKTDLTQVPWEETCKSEYARWQVLYQVSVVYEKMSARDWQGAFDETAPLDGVGLTCWERAELAHMYAMIFGSTGEIDKAVSFLDQALAFNGLGANAVESLEQFKAELNAGDWKYQTASEREMQAREDEALGVADRDAYEIEKPKIQYLKQAMRRYNGNALCFVYLDVTEVGIPYNINAICSFEKFEKAAVKAVSKARFSPKYKDGVPVETFRVMYPFDLRMG